MFHAASIPFNVILYARWLKRLQTRAVTYYNIIVEDGGTQYYGLELDLVVEIEPNISFVVSINYQILLSVLRHTFFLLLSFCGITIVAQTIITSFTSVYRQLLVVISAHVNWAWYL